MSARFSYSFKYKNIILSIRFGQFEDVYNRDIYKLEEWIIKTIRYEQERNLVLLDTISNHNIRNIIIDYCNVPQRSFREFICAIEKKDFKYSYVNTLRYYNNNICCINYKRPLIKFYDSTIVRISDDNQNIIDFDNKVFIIISKYSLPVVQTFEQLL
jgi:hypothetical protein